MPPEGKLFIGDLAHQAADEIELPREALREMIYQTTSLSPMEPDGSHWCRITAEALGKARDAYNKSLGKA